MNNEFPWGALETIAGLAAVPAFWRERLGEQLGPFKTAFLQKQAGPVGSHPCPRQCGCAHEVVRHGDGSFAGICRCEPWNCDDLVLTLADITPLAVNVTALGRALCRAFELDSRTAALGLPHTAQFASYTAEAVPVILTVQAERPDFRLVVAELVARLRRSFILFGPTSVHLDAVSTELLASAGAGFFGLDATVTLTEHGILQPAKSPGELFARFGPTAEEPVEEDIARQAFALVQQLDAEGSARPPTALTVFRLYCMEELTAGQIARRCGCGKTTIIDRLNLIRAKTGVAPEDLRRLSPHFNRLEGDISDSRARRIYRKGAIYGEDADESAE